MWWLGIKYPWPRHGGIRLEHHPELMGRQDIQRDCYWYSALTGSDWDKTDDSVNTIKDTYSDEKIDHEEDIEGKIYLLSSVGGPGNTGLNFFTENTKIWNSSCFEILQLMHLQSLAIYYVSVAKFCISADFNRNWCQKSCKLQPLL